MNPRSLQLDEWTSPEIRTLIADGYRTVIVPLGATEQHGPALPLCVDNAQILVSYGLRLPGYEHDWPNGCEQSILLSCRPRSYTALFAPVPAFP